MQEPINFSLTEKEDCYILLRYTERKAFWLLSVLNPMTYKKQAKPHRVYSKSQMHRKEVSLRKFAVGAKATTWLQPGTTRHTMTTIRPDADIPGWKPTCFRWVKSLPILEESPSRDVIVWLKRIIVMWKAFRQKPWNSGGLRSHATGDIEHIHVYSVILRRNFLSKVKAEFFSVIRYAERKSDVFVFQEKRLFQRVLDEVN